MFLQTDNFQSRFLCESDLHILCLQQAMKKLSELDTYWVRKTIVSSTLDLDFESARDRDRDMWPLYCTAIGGISGDVIPDL